MTEILDIIQDGGGYYYFKTSEELDNIQSLRYFFDNVLVDFAVLEEYDTSAEVLFEGHWIYLNSFGNGDFYSHVIEIELKD